MKNCLFGNEKLTEINCADLNGDEQVNVFDFSILKNNIIR